MSQAMGIWKLPVGKSTCQNLKRSQTVGNLTRHGGSWPLELGVTLSITELIADSSSPALILFAPG